MTASAGRLPRGRHGLPRGEVVASQRERMLRGIAEATAEKGYAATTVADVLRRAGVSRETFYEQFSSKEDCFMSAFEAALDRIVAGGIAGSGSGPPARQLERVLGNYLEALAAEPAFARLFLLEIHALGDSGLARRAAAQERIAEMIADLFGAHSAEDRFACTAFVAATSSLVTARLAAGDIAGLRRLRKPLVKLAVRMLES